MARSFKLIRKFQKLQLLLHVLATTMDALKLLLFLVCLIVLIFGCAFYVLEPHTMDSLSTSIFLCTVHSHHSGHLRHEPHQLARQAPSRSAVPHECRPALGKTHSMIEWDT